MNKKISAFFTTALTLLIVTSLVSPVAAETTRGNAGSVSYTQTTGNLNGANYVIRIPDNWNGILLVGCHAYFVDRDPNQQFQFDDLASIFIAQGYAYAASDYGAQGYCVNAGFNQTYELTLFVKSHYNVTLIILIGGSMGGEIALLLGEKYPNIYSGVLDICGPKDLVTMYNDGSYIAGSTLEQIRAFYGWPATIPADSTVQFFKDFATKSGVDLIAETGGTPTAVPQAYEKISPINHVNISIPVISLVGAKDYIVLLSQTQAYQNAVAAAGHSEYYTMIVVQNGGHIDAVTMAQASDALSQLISKVPEVPPFAVLLALFVVATILLLAGKKLLANKPNFHPF